MASVNFYLREPKSTKETPINMFFSYGGKKPMKYPTLQKVLPAHWNEDKQRIRERRNIADSEERNAYLNKIEGAINSIHKLLLIEGLEVDEAILKERLDIELKRVVKPKLNQLSAYCTHIVAQKKELGTSDYFIVKMAADNLAQYAALHKVVLNFEDMNLTFRAKFLHFLNTKQYKQNSIHTCFSALRIILTQAQEDGYNPFNTFRSRKFSVKSEKVRKSGLNLEEINKIKELDLSSDKQLDDIRDLFLIGFCTTMRVSDYRKLKKENFENGQVVRKTKKTGKYVNIPMHSILRDILTKRNGELPHSYSTDQINDHIKKIAKMAGITQPVVVSFTRGGERVDQVVEKWQTITSHTARRASVREMRKAGIDKDKAKLLSGHESDSAFNIYDETDTEENAIALANHPYFK